MTKMQRHTSVTGDERHALTQRATKLYLAGATIREVADQLGRSYGFIHKLLHEGDVAIRARGGSYRDRLR